MPDLPEKDSGKIRILHTADWHLGRAFHEADLSGFHQTFFDWLVEQVGVLEVDAVLMAGDIFDRAVAPVLAVKMLNRELARISEIAPVVLIAGNHDSVARMGHGALLKPGIHLSSGTDSVGEPVMVEDGPFPLAIYPIPYLDPVTLGPELGVEEFTHQAVIDAAVARCLEDLAGRPEGTRAVAIGHAFVSGATTSDSERSIAIGGASEVTASSFEGFDYVALGHLHRPQDIGERIRYSGSPIHLSYSEVGPEKSATVIDLSSDGTVTKDTVAIPQLFNVARISGTLEELLNDEKFERYREDWVEVELTDETRPDQPLDRLRTRFENVMTIRFKAPLVDVDPTGEGGADFDQIEPIELINRFIEHVRGDGPDAEEEKLLEEALESAAAADLKG